MTQLVTLSAAVEVFIAGLRSIDHGTTVTGSERAGKIRLPCIVPDEEWRQNIRLRRGGFRPRSFLPDGMRNNDRSENRDDAEEAEADAGLNDSFLNLAHGF